MSEPSSTSIEGWIPETFDLPPGFAPELPRGVEALLLAPGFRDPTAEDHWSYAFVMWIEEPAPDAARLDDIFEAYYDGLLSAVADRDIGSDPAQVEVVRTASNRFEAQVQAIDAFGTYERMDLRLLISVEVDERTVLSVQVSPQPREHEIWRVLDAASASIRER